MEKIRDTALSGRQRRVRATCGIILLHSTCYYLVNLINSRRPALDLFDFGTVIDRWVPYLNWTWVLYYSGNVYITIWAAIIFWHIPEIRLRQATYAYVGMIIVGAATQVMIPGKAPWPTVLVPPQQWVHELIAMRPYACLPSMHVALTVLPCCFGLAVLSSPWLKILSGTMAALITISTLTLKEHYFLDAAAGLVLGLVSYAYWQWGFQRIGPR
jgi:membrane-associated phospholipid phosphatase